MSERSVDAVVFDLGGVLMRNGRPKDMSARFPDHDIADVIMAVMGPYHLDTDHHWHRLERGEITLAEARAAGKVSLAAAGISAAPDATPGPGPESSRGAAKIGPDFGRNEEMFALVGDLRAAGIRTGVLTNNVREFRELWWPLAPWSELFDDVLDSSDVGMRKPNPAIYRLSAERLDVPTERIAFLDDVMSNVTAAQGVGMFGIFVDDDWRPAIDTARALAAVSAAA